jgi:hypothetical protein
MKRKERPEKWDERSIDKDDLLYRAVQRAMKVVVGF